jgi:hypothetical protein
VIDIAVIVLAIAVAIWLVLAVMSLVSREKMPKLGLREVEKRLLGGTVFLALVWIIVFGSALKAKKSDAVAASVLPSASNGSCASVRPGMNVRDAKSVAGEPDEIRSEEAVRGPGAKVWIYKGSRCAIHITNDLVELVE